MTLRKCNLKTEKGVLRWICWTFSGFRNFSIKQKKEAIREYVRILKNFKESNNE